MIRIVIMDRGFVSVGEYKEDGAWCELTNAAIVRRWGTTRGLGEIAENGPTASTVLDKSPTQRFPVHAVINTLECVAEKWTDALGLKK